MSGRIGVLLWSQWSQWSAAPCSLTVLRTGLRWPWCGRPWLHGPTSGVNGSGIRCSARRMASASVGLIIIGDEILKGQTQDINTHFLAQKLRTLGVSLKRVSIIPDDVAIIAQEVRTFSAHCDVVLTSGGIGPTHDDLTFEGVARAFDDEVKHHPEIVHLVKTWFKTEDPNAPALKLALVPSRAQLNFGIDPQSGEELKFPIVSVHNVYVFPGIPKLLQRGFEGLIPTIFGHLKTRHVNSDQVFVNDSETNIADRLNSLVQDHPRVTFGSYPEWSHPYFQTKLTLEADTQDLLQAAKADLQGRIPTMTYDPRPFDHAMDKIHELMKSSSHDLAFQRALHEAQGTVEQTLEKYAPEEVAVCFNGGKDCIVMLHLVHAHFQRHFPQKRLQTIYIKEKDPFPEVAQFILETESKYNLDALNIDGGMKVALRKMLEDRPRIQCTFLGTRQGDPGSQHQGLFSPTDGDWPRLMRVNPVLNWEYRHVWRFIRSLNLTYPSLYDQGYTSLGSRSNTVKNPVLAVDDGSGRTRYKPAYELTDGSQERAGRATPRLA